MESILLQLTKTSPLKMGRNVSALRRPRTWSLLAETRVGWAAGDQLVSCRLCEDSSWKPTRNSDGSFPMALKNPNKTNSGSPRCPRLRHGWKWGSRTTLGFKEIKQERACHLIHDPFQAWTGVIRAIRYQHRVKHAQQELKVSQSPGMTIWVRLKMGH